MATEPLSEDKKKIFEYISAGDLESVRRQFSALDCNVDIIDEHGMTPLSHAAFKGNKEICQYLLDQGADVNCDKHEHKYTALHFAVLSGNKDVVLLLLESGAKSHHINSVGRTPSQMAGFVGNQHCSSIINNFMPKTDIEYYSIPHGTESSPKIPPKCVSPLYKLVMQVNIHPIRIALNLSPHLVPEMVNVAKVLKLLSEKEMTRGSESNEILSMKYHYLHYIVTEVSKFSVSDKQSSDPVEMFVKKLIRGMRGDEYLDSLVRDAVREFPYREVSFFRQVVSGLVEVKNSAGSALGVLRSALNGELHAPDESRLCATCCDPDPPKRCSKCKDVRYCDRKCQRLHWPIHKKECCRLTSSPDQITSQIEHLTT